MCVWYGLQRKTDQTTPTIRMTFGLLGQILVSRQTLFRQSTYNRSDVNCQHVADLGLRFQIVLQSMDESMLRFG